MRQISESALVDGDGRSGSLPLHFRDRQHLNETVSLVAQRRLFQDHWDEVCAVLQAA